jgi:hypothetical protein
VAGFRGLGPCDWAPPAHARKLRCSKEKPSFISPTPRKFDYNGSTTLLNKRAEGRAQGNREGNARVVMIAKFAIMSGAAASESLDLKHPRGALCRRHRHTPQPGR